VYAMRLTMVGVLAWFTLVAVSARELVPIWFPPPEVHVSRPLNTLERLVQQGSRDPGVYFELSILYAQAGQWRQAREACLQLRALDADNVNSYQGEAYAWVHLGHPRKALVVIEEGIKRIRDKVHVAWLYRTRGDVLLHLFEKQKQARLLSQAEQAYRQALKYDKQVSLAWIGLARISLWRKQHQLVDRFAKNSLRVAKTARERALGYYFLGKAAQLRKENDKAKELFSRALREPPKSFQIAGR
jgi:tetratricopeptide (TPR) repeat protein